MMRRLGYLAVFLSAFLVTAAVTLPLEVLAGRWMFGRLERSLGLAARAESLRFDLLALPPGLVAENVTIAAAAAGPSSAVEVPGVRFVPGLGVLLGRRDLAVVVDPGSGQIRIDLEPDGVRVMARDVALDRIPALRALGSWRFSGSLSLDGRWTGRTRAASRGEFSWEIREAAVSGARLAGIDFPPTRLGAARGRLTLEAGTLSLSGARAEGGEVRAVLEGRLTLTDPWRDSVLSLETRLTPTPEWEQALGPAARFLKYARRDDGTIGFTTAGTPAALRVELR